MIYNHKFEDLNSKAQTPTVAALKINPNQSGINPFFR